MVKMLSVVLGLIGMLWLAPAPAVAQGASLRLEARLSASGQVADGKVRYEERQVRGLLQQRLTVEIEDAVPSRTYSVIHKGIVVAKVTTNQFGFGKIELRVNGDDPGKNVAWLPRMRAGEAVRVGPLSGTLTPR